MLISKENVPALFNPFRVAIGDELFSKVCNDAKALFGRVDKDIQAEGGDWKVKGKVSKGEVANKATYTLLLPANNPISSLTLAALDVREMCKRHVIEHGDIQVPLPKACVSWIEQAKKEVVKLESVEA